MAGKQERRDQENAAAHTPFLRRTHADPALEPLRKLVFRLGTIPVDKLPESARPGLNDPPPPPPSDVFCVVSRAICGLRDCYSRVLFPPQFLTTASLCWSVVWVFPSAPARQMEVPPHSNMRNIVVLLIASMHEQTVRVYHTASGRYRHANGGSLESLAMRPQCEVAWSAFCVATGQSISPAEDICALPQDEERTTFVNLTPAPPDSPVPNRDGTDANDELIRVTLEQMVERERWLRQQGLGHELDLERSDEPHGTQEQVDEGGCRSS